MNFRATTVVVLVLAVIWGAIQLFTGNVSEVGGVRFVPSSSVRLWIDPETGCEYFAEAWRPRLDRNGRQLCSEEGATDGENPAHDRPRVSPSAER